MDIVVKGRNVEVPDHFRVHVSEKLTRAERYDPKMNRVDVELSHEKNPRQSKVRQRVQLTVTGRGPAVRAEAAAESFYAALDLASGKLETRLRKARGRRLDRVTSRPSMGQVAAEVGDDELVADGVAGITDQETDAARERDEYTLGDQDSDGPGRIVRVKNHSADPITVDQALFQMELVGHDFYLFTDAESGFPSVVYRRKGFDYGLLHLG